MHPYFDKTFDLYNLGNVNYTKCLKCGFCASSTHFSMPNTEWESLNLAFHNDSDTRKDNPYNRNQRYFNQALMLHLLIRNGLLKQDNWLDWGSGSGPLSLVLKQQFGIKINNFDKFMQPKLHNILQHQMVSREYGLVVNTAVFEHVRDRETLDEIESYVSESGCLAIHTLVRGQIPADPEWMYLLPVHCAFHTNKSMGVLMNQWGYTCSVYNEQSKMWVWFKNRPQCIAEKVIKMNRSMGWEYLHFKTGFMDFWP